MATPRSLLLAAVAVVALAVSTGDAEARSNGYHGNRHRHVACAPRAYYGGTAAVRYRAYRVRRPYVTVPVYAPYYVMGPYIYDPVVYGPTGFIGFGGRHVRVGIAF